MELLSNPEIILRILLQIGLLSASAFFSSSETALFSLSPAHMQRLRAGNHPQVERIQQLLDHPRRLIVSILCGNELINIAASINLAALLLVIFGSPETAALLNILLMVPILLLFGEITPKTIAVTNPVAVATRVHAVPMSLWVRAIAPLRFVVRLVSDSLTTLIVGEQRKTGSILGVDEFRSLLSDVEDQGVITGTERVLIENLVEAGETDIEDIMVPRPRIVFLNADQPVAEIIEQFKRARHGRVPVYRGHRDTLVGFLHAEDLVALTMEGRDPATMALDDLLRPAVVVPPTKRVDEMFGFFRARNCRAAAVVNEFGGVDGLITLADVLAFLARNVRPVPVDPRDFVEIAPRTHEVSGLLRLETFNALTSDRLEDDHMTTIGGYVFRHLDRLPSVGETVAIEELTFTVLEMEGHLIRKVRVAPPEAVIEEPAADAPDDAGGEAGKSPQAPPPGEPA